jgi:septum formation protein
VKLSCPLILASASPRRREILTRLGLAFEVSPADVDESERAGEAPQAYVMRLAETKARAVAERRPGSAVLGADTTVVLDGAVLNKPGDLAESERMLRALRGREHVVFTGVAVFCARAQAIAGEAQSKVIHVATRVRFRDFSDATLLAYVASGEGLDKAGAYGIQDLGAALVSEVHGSYSNVVGLPAAETVALLEDLGVLEVWP